VSLSAPLAPPHHPRVPFSFADAQSLTVFLRRSCSYLYGVRATIPRGVPLFPPVEQQKRDLRPRPPPPQSTTAAFVHPYSIADSSCIVEVIGTRDTIDVFQPAPLQHRRDPRGTHAFLVLVLKTDHVIRRPFRRRGHPRTIGIIGARGTVKDSGRVHRGGRDALRRLA